jgi:hypothetical protein
MRRLTYLLRGGDERRRGGEGDGGESPDERDEPLPVVEPAQAARARGELGQAIQMLNLLEELLAMQDYTFSQMGTYSQ